jgi:hypothetical protein
MSDIEAPIWDWSFLTSQEFNHPVWQVPGYGQGRIANGEAPLGIDHFRESLIGGAGSAAGKPVHNPVIATRRALRLPFAAAINSRRFAPVVVSLAEQLHGRQEELT